MVPAFLLPSLCNPQKQPILRRDASSFLFLRRNMQQFNAYPEAFYYGGGQQMIDPNQISVFGDGYQPGADRMDGSRTASPEYFEMEGGVQKNKPKRTYAKTPARYNEATDTWERKKKTPRLSRTIQMSFLSGLAFHNSGKDECTLREIYAFVCEHFEGYDIGVEAWKKSVRHSLCTHKGFYARKDGEANWGFSHKDFFMIKFNEYLDKTADIRLLGLKNIDSWPAIYNGTAGIPPPIAIQRPVGVLKRKALLTEGGEKKARAGRAEAVQTGPVDWNQVQNNPEQFFNPEYMQQYMQYYAMYGGYPQEFPPQPVVSPVDAQSLQYPDSPTPIDHRDYCAKPPSTEPAPVALEAPQEAQPYFYGYPYYPMGQQQGQVYPDGAPGQEGQGDGQVGLETYYQQMYPYYYQPEGQLVPQAQDPQQGYYFPGSPQESHSVQEAPRQLAVKQEPLQL